MSGWPALFICYRRKPSEDFVLRLHAQLEDRGLEVFLDEKDISGGAEIPDRVRKGLEKSSALLVIIGPNWLKSVDGTARLEKDDDWVKKEIELGLELKLNIVPVFHGEASMPNRSELPDSIKQLAAKKGVPVRSEMHFFKNDVDRLIKELQGLPPKAGSTVTSSDQKAEAYKLIRHCPHRLDRDIYDKVWQAVLSATDSQIDRPGCVAVIGMPGIGKSVLAHLIAARAYRDAHFDRLVLLSAVEQEMVPRLFAAAIRQLLLPEAETTSVEKARQAIRLAVSGGHCLVVLDDVWVSEVAQSVYQALGQGSVLFLTTRNELVARGLTKTVFHLEPFSVEEGAGFLLPESEPGGNGWQMAAELVKEVGGNPLVLHLLRSRVVGPQSLPRLLKETRRARETDDDACSPIGKALALLRARLSDLHKSDPELAGCYLTLSAFPRSEPIPLPVLLAFWERRGIDPLQAQDNLAELEGQTLLRWEKASDRIILHSLWHDCIAAEAGDIRASHELLLDITDAPRATSGTVIGVYGVEHRIHHLLGAGKREECFQLLGSVDWLGLRMEHGGVAGVVSDLLLAGRQQIDLAGVWKHLVQLLTDSAKRRQQVTLQELGVLLSQTFGRYEKWPSDLRTVLESSADLSIRWFLGKTLDREEAFEPAQKVYGKLIDEGRRQGDIQRELDGTVGLAEVHRHAGRHEDALWVLQSLAGRPELGGLRVKQRKWLDYHLAISLRDCGAWREAGARLEMLRDDPRHGPDARHQLAILYLGWEREGNLELAQRELEECLQVRDKHDERFIHDWRRLAQVHAMRGGLKQARELFNKAKEQSRLRGDLRYVGQIGRDLTSYVELAPWIVERPRERFDVGDLPEMKYTGEDRDTVVREAFRVAARRGVQYLPLIAPGSGILTREVAPWETVHQQGLCHPTVTVLLFDRSGQLVLQARKQPNRNGRLAASVAGHQHPGEDDFAAAIRETREGTGLNLEPRQLCRVFPRSHLVKQGKPEVTGDQWLSPFHFVYHREPGSNFERTSLFLAVLSEVQQEHLRDFERIGVHRLLGETMSPNDYASSVRQLARPEVEREIETTLARARYPLGIEFLITGPAKAGKSSVAQAMAEHYGGSVFNMSALNRTLAWWILEHELDPEWLKEPACPSAFERDLSLVRRDLRFDRNGKARFKGKDIHGALESPRVTEKAVRQSSQIYRYREQMNPMIWQIITELRSKGPVFIMSRRRSSVRTASRAVYLHASLQERVRRLKGLGVEGNIRQGVAARDGSETTILQRPLCDSVVDTDRKSVEESLAAVGIEYQKAHLVARMDFFNLRYLCASTRQRGRRIMLERLESGRTALVAAVDMDRQGWICTAFGHTPDVLAYFQAVLAEIVARSGGRLITWGTDDSVLFFPLELDQTGAMVLLERVRREYLVRTHQRLGTAIVRGLFALSAGQRALLEDALGRFAGRVGDEDHIIFEVGPNTSLADACEKQVELINSYLPDSAPRLRGEQPAFVPLSTVSIGATFVCAGEPEASLDRALDAAYDALSAAKKQRNACVLADSGTHADSSARPTLFDEPTVRELRALLAESPVREQEGREQYPRVLRMATFETLTTQWLQTRSQQKPVFLLAVRPFFGGDQVTARVRKARESGTVLSPPDTPLRWGYRFRTLVKLYNRLDRELLITASAHFIREELRSWLAESHASASRHELVSHLGRGIEGLRAPLRTFWLIEGAADPTRILQLLGRIARRLQSVVPSLRTRMFALCVPVDGVDTGGELLDRADEFYDAAPDQVSSRSDDEGNTVRTYLSDERRSDERRREQLKNREEALRGLDRREKELDASLPLLRWQVESERRVDAIRGLAAGGTLAGRCALAVVNAVQVFRSLEKNGREVVLACLGDSESSRALRRLLDDGVASDWLDAFRAVGEYIGRHGFPAFGYQKPATDPDALGRIQQFFMENPDERLLAFDAVPKASPEDALLLKT